VSDKPKCHANKADGSRCGALALPGQEHCFFHAPSREQERAAARSRGGQASRRKAAVLPLDTAELALATVDDVVKLLAQTINQTRTGRLDTRTANAVGYLCGILLKALQDSDLDRRIAALEQQRAHQASGPAGRFG
jgi:hypothetical protein